MNLLITGANGLVGSHFVDTYSKKDIHNLNILTPTRKDLDIINEESVKNFFKNNQPNIIIHFAAFTDVSAAEEQKNEKSASCWTTNVLGTLNLVNALSYQPYFIYISTDSVFSGLKNNPGPYKEDSPTEKNPDYLSWYGWSKREAEKLISDRLENFAILRIANPVRAKYKLKLDYVRRIIHLYDTNSLYPMFNDQFLTLTYINEVTETLMMLIEKKLKGVFHVSSTNIFTPFELASLLLKKTRDKINIVKPASIANFLKSNPSRYPQYGGLSVDKTQEVLNKRFLTWQQIIEELVKQWLV